MNLYDLGNLLKKWRTAAKLSSAFVADGIGLSATYYSRVETGKERPSRQVLENISKLYSLPVEDQRLLEQLAGYATNAPVTDSLATNGQPTVKLNPETLPVLFSDAMYVTISENGVVFDFGQKVGPTNEQQIVARIGVSLSHAKRIHAVLGDQLSKIKNMGIEN